MCVCSEYLQRSLAGRSTRAWRKRCPSPRVVVFRALCCGFWVAAWAFNQTKHAFFYRLPWFQGFPSGFGRWHVHVFIIAFGNLPIVNTFQEIFEAKVQNFQDLARELRKLWQVKVKVVPVVVGALATIPKALEKHLKEIGTSVRVELLQKAALLGQQDVAWLEV